MSAEIISLAERGKADKARFAAYLKGLREQALALQERLDDLTAVIAVAERLIGGNDAMTDGQLAALEAQLSGTDLGPVA